DVLARRADEDRDGDIAAPGVVRARLEFLDAVGQAFAAAADGHPAIAVFEHAVEGARAVAADEHGRMWLLLRLRPRPNGVEVDELAVVFGLVVGPDRLHGEDAFAQDLPAQAVLRAVVF